MERGAKEKSEVSNTETKSSKNIYCPNCYRQNPYDAIYCKFCGEKIWGESPDAPSPKHGFQPSKKFPYKKVFLIIIIIGILITVLFVANFISSIRDVQEARQYLYVKLTNEGSVGLSVQILFYTGEYNALGYSTTRHVGPGDSVTIKTYYKVQDIKTRSGLQSVEVRVSYGGYIMSSEIYTFSLYQDSWKLLSGVNLLNVYLTGSGYFIDFEYG